jgi:hypothetical protein
MKNQLQFLYAVRTCFIAAGREKCMTGRMFDLLDASERIPFDMPTAQAAEEFCEFYGATQTRRGREPTWFARIA